jgi:hypothetical protein
VWLNSNLLRCCLLLEKKLFVTPHLLSGFNQILFCFARRPRLNFERREFYLWMMNRREILKAGRSWYKGSIPKKSVNDKAISKDDTLTCVVISYVSSSSWAHGIATPNRCSLLAVLGLLDLVTSRARRLIMLAFTSTIPSRESFFRSNINLKILTEIYNYIM